jgi:integrase
LARDVAAPKTFASKSDAAVWLATVQADLARGELLNPRESRLTLDVWADRWLGGLAVKNSTRQQYESSWRVHVAPVFGRREARSVTYADCVNFIKELEERGHGPGTVGAARKVLRLVLSEAERADAIRRNPAADLRVRRSAPEEMVFLDAFEVEGLAEAIAAPAVGDPRPSYGLLIRLAAWTGLRAGEIAALRSGRVNPLAGRVEVVESADDRSGRVLIGPTKTYSRRSVPIPRALAAELGDHVATLGPDPEAFVFTAPHGGPLAHRNFYRRHYRPAVQRATLPARTRFHDLRHTAAALMIAEGAHVLAVKERLGHSSVTVTMDRYGHLFPSVEEALTERLDEVYRNARVASSA